MQGLTVDAAGDLFGTTSTGSSGSGTVFEIAAGTTTVNTLATFGGSKNGSHPTGKLLLVIYGDIFGTTDQGGLSGNGTIFELPALFCILSSALCSTSSNPFNPAWPFSVEQVRKNI